MDKITLDQLKQKSIWLVWGLEYDGKDQRTAKIPTNPTNGTKKWDDPRLWGTYEQAQNFISKKPNAHTLGMGFVCGVMPSDNNTVLCFLDLDASDSTGKMTDPALDVLAMFDGKTYIEKSYSTKGRHIYFLMDANKLPTNQKEAYNLKNSKADMEFYATTKHFSVVTGLEAENSCKDKTIYNLTDLGLQVLNTYFKKNNVQPTSPALQEFLQLQEAERQEVNIETLPPRFNNKLDVLQAALKAKNGDKFKALYYDGDLSYNDNDHSSADLALLQILAFYAGDNAALIEEMFRESALFRPEKLVKSPKYLADSISKAIQHAQAARAATASTYNNNFTVPNAGKKSNNRKPLTLDIFNQWLIDNGISAKWNAINHKNEIKRIGDRYDPTDDTLHILIHDVLKRDYICSKSDILDNMHTIAYKNKYNPILELLADADRIKQLEADKDSYRIVYDKDPDYFSILTDDLMQLPQDDTLSRALIRKWLINTRLLWDNTNRDESNWINNEAVLVLNGGQGIGKTRLVSKLGFNNALLCRTGVSIDPNNKDSVIGATTYALVEVGELETTFKRDIEALKNFITDNHDNYRPPYGREEKTYPRLTAFIGTCNSDRFLKDETGNRRYFTIPCVNKFNNDTLANFNAFGLWKQVEEWIAAGETYILTDEETQALNTRNSGCVDLLRGQQEIKDILTHARNNSHEYAGMWLTATQFKEKYMDTLRPYTAQQIGKSLKAEGLEQCKKSLTDVETGKRKTVEGYYLPVPVGVIYDNTTGRPIKPANPYTPHDQLDNNADKRISFTS